MSEVGKLSEEAEKRRERLRALKSKASNPGDGPASKKPASEGALPRPVFRSYKPSDETLKESVIPKAKPVDVADIVKEQLDASKPEPLVEDIDLTTLAPRKPDWDLKRDVSKKLEKLERQTQRKIAELILERLQTGKEENLATAVDAASQIRPDED